LRASLGRHVGPWIRQATALPHPGHLKRALPSRSTTDQGGLSIGTYLISHDGKHVPQDRNASVSSPPTLPVLPDRSPINDDSKAWRRLPTTRCCAFGLSKATRHGYLPTFEHVWRLRFRGLWRRRSALCVDLIVEDKREQSTGSGFCRSPLLACPSENGASQDVY
jgi:hypothetical protein